MQYGIEQNVLETPYSLIVSILLSIGSINFKLFILRFSRKYNFINSKKIMFFFLLLIVFIQFFPAYLVLIF